MAMVIANNSAAMLTLGELNKNITQFGKFEQFGYFIVRQIPRRKQHHEFQRKEKQDRRYMRSRGDSYGYGSKSQLFGADGIRGIA